MRYLVSLISLLTLLCLPVFVLAQTQEEEEDGGFIANLLQDALSSDNRGVQVIGLEGALSSSATIRQIVISDDDGVWLTINEAVLDWRRAALLRGRLAINTLSAASIEVARPPLPTEPDPELPSPVATPFQVPELPVSIEIGELRVDELILGEPVIGIAATLSIAGNLTLADGSLATDLAINRLDRATDKINIIAGFANDTRQINVDIDIQEVEGGLLAEVLKIPERPSVGLGIKGSGPVSDFTADIRLATAGQERLGGQVRLSEAESGAGAIRFVAGLAGDLTPLMEPQFHDFFGTESRLDLEGQTGENGRLDLESFALTSRALDLSGSARIAEGGAIGAIDFDGVLAAPDSASIVLPVAGASTELRRAEFDVTLDADAGSGWSVSAFVEGFRQPDIALERLSLDATGTLVQDGATELIGDLDAGLSGLTFADAALQSAVGDAITLNGGFDWTAGGLVTLSDFVVAGADYTARMTARIDGLNSGFAVSGNAEVEAGDLSRFSGLAGRQLGGAVSVQAEGSGSPLGGAFDVRLTLGAQDLSADIAQLDPLIAGSSRVVLDVGRDETGTELREFDVQSTALTASGNGTIRAGVAELRLNARLDDLGRIVPQTPGEVTLVANVIQSGETVNGRAEIRAPDETFVDLEGTIWQDGRIEGDFDAALNEIENFVPQLTGSLTAKGQARRDVQSAWTFAAATGGDLGLEGDFDGRFDETSGAIELRFDTGFDRVERLVPQLVGAVRLSGEASRTEAAVWQGQIETGGSIGLNGRFGGQFDEQSGAADLSFNTAFERVERLVPQLVGAVRLSGEAKRSEEAEWKGQIDTGGSIGLSGQFSGRLDEQCGAADLSFDAAMQRLERFVPQLVGALDARGSATRSEELVWGFDLQTAGSAGISGAFLGRFEEQTGIAALEFDALFAQLERFVPQLAGNLAASGIAERSSDLIWTTDLQTDGSAGIKGAFDGEFNETTGALDVIFDAALSDLQRLVPGLTGALEARGRARRSEEMQWLANAVTRGDAGLTGTFKAEFDEPSGDTELYFDAALERLQRLVPEVNGTLNAAGQVDRTGDVWRIDTIASGPGGMTADVDGSFDQARNELDMAAKGRVRLGLANPFLAPNSIKGDTDFDLTIQGKPGIDAISGTITSAGASMAIPTVAQTIVNLNTNVSLANATANISINGGLRAGGGFRVSGPIGLEPPFAGNVTIDLLDLILTDNLIFNSSANGQITVNGPLTGGANIAGQINFGETEINVSNASGAVGAAPIPEIRHIGEPANARRTRARAGLIETEKSSGGGPSYGLNVTLNAPDRIFARGRGLNAELGGSLVIRGSTDNVIPVGQISMIRGVFDILGRRLTLDEGEVTLQGGLDPFLYFVATSDTSDGDATLTIAGPASSPRIEVTSTPERPSEEALALLLFGNQFEDLSPLQIAQLGAQVAALAGRGGGFVNSVREDLGVDNLDLTTDEDGNAQVGIGTYITEDIYTDVTVNAEGDSEVTLNIDLTDTLTAKGSVDNEGNTGIGLFFQQDY